MPAQARHRALVAAAAAIVTLTGALVPGDAAAQQRRNQTAAATPAASIDKDRMNANTIAIVAGKSDSTYLAIVEDLTNVLDDGDDLRVLAVVGRGAVQNVRDVLFLRGMDLGITQSNVLAHLKKTGELGPNPEARLVYVTKLFNEEIHLVVRSDIEQISDLAGKAVNFGQSGSSGELAARQILDAVGVAVRPTTFDVADALTRMRSGEIAATFVVAGKPSTVIERLKGGEFKLLPIPFEEALEADYLPTSLTHADYPDLIPDGERVDTIAVASVLAAFNWAPNSDRGRRMSKFIDAFFGRFLELRKESRHPKWREVNLLAEVPGWRRLPTAQQWLDQRKPPPVAAATQVAAPARPAQLRGSFEQFLAAQRAGGGTGGGLPSDSESEQAMFQRFIQWMQQNQSGGGGARPALPAAAPAAGGESQPRQPTGGTRLW